MIIINYIPLCTPTEICKWNEIIIVKNIVLTDNVRKLQETSKEILATRIEC